MNLRAFSYLGLSNLQTYSFNINYEKILKDFFKENDVYRILNSKRKNYEGKRLNKLF